jgi:type III secretion protein D
MNKPKRASFELRVLQGEQQGASTAVAAGATVHIGSGVDSDIVLRGLAQALGTDGSGPGAMRLSVKAAPDGVHLAVQEGRVQAGGRTVAAGQATVVPVGTPLTLGEIQIALVHADPELDAQHEPTPTAAPAGTPAAAEAAQVAAENDRYARWPQRLLAGGAALAAVSVGVLAFAYTAAPTPATPEQQARRAETLLHGAAMPRLTVRADAQGVLQVTGYLETAAQRARAEQLLADDELPRPPAAGPAQWQVWVNEAVVAAVQDVFRAKGITATATAVGPGAVRVQTREADPLMLEEVSSTARRDVPGLVTLEVQNTVPQMQGRPAVVDDPGKRVASIVPGDPPYVVTVDGTRYFEGALLPSGHRIAAIEEKQVLLEFNGVRTPLIF